MSLSKTHIKICGLTRTEDAQLALDLGAWALGFVFYDKSPRAMKPEAVRGIVSHLRGDAHTVGVFVNASREEIDRAVEISGVTHVQLHGDESEEFCSALPYKKIKALTLNAAVSNYKGVDYFLIDSRDESGLEKKYGGTGKTVDWSLASKCAREHQILLAGGLTPSNVAEAISIVKPFGVDISSGVEESPRIKSAQKLEEFFRSVRSIK